MDLEQALRAFKDIASKRGWDSLHSPKNLAIAVSNEAAELLQEFHWLTEQESQELAQDRDARNRIGSEAADVLLYLLALCDKLDIDLEDAVQRKQALNRKRFIELP